MERKAPEPVAEEQLLIGEFDAAKKLSIHPNTLANMRKAGQIPHVRVRARVMYRVSTLNEWVAQQEVVATV